MSTSVPAFPARRPSTSSPFSHLAKKDDKPADIDDPDDDDDDDEDVDDTDEQKAKKKAKKAKKAKADDADDEADESKSDARATRLRERARIRTIVNSAAGKQSPATALHLALGTSMPRWAAVKLLGSMNENNVPQGDNLRDRMARTEQPDIGAGAAQSHVTQGGSAGLAAAIIQAGCKRRGEV
jgi:hypothetical protein